MATMSDVVGEAACALVAMVVEPGFTADPVGWCSV